MSETLVKDRDVTVYRNETSYCVIGVPELLQNGEMVCVLQEQARRKYRTHSDPSARIVLLRSQDNGDTWNPGTRTLVADAEDEAVVGPAIKQLRDGTLIVTYFKLRMGGDDEVPAEQPSEDEETGMHFANSAGGDNLHTLDGEHYAWRNGAYTIRSTDNGATWEEPVYVPAPTGRETSVNDPVTQLPNGDLLVPLYASRPGEMHQVIVMRSTDGGKSWGDPVTAAFDPLGNLSFEEPSLLYLPSGKLICMIRVHRLWEQEYGYYLYQTDSYDLGKTWSTPRQTSIWGFPPDMVHLASGNILCVYGYRRPPFGIRACLSHDEGRDLGHPERADTTRRWYKQGSGLPHLGAATRRHHRGYVNRCVNDIRRRPSQPLIQWRFHPHTVHRGRRLRSTQGPSDA